VNQVNKYRASVGLTALQNNQGQEGCVDTQAKVDYTNDKAHSDFGACNEYGQCECPGWPNPASILKCLAQMWAEGPGGGHYDIMTTNYSSMACGYYTASSTDTWMTQDFWY